MNLFCRSESEVILESLLTFSKLLNALGGYKFHLFQVTAAVRIKLIFGQEDVQLRRAAFQLLGDLTSSLNPDTNMEAFKEQIQGNLITLLLHLCDQDIYVIKVSEQRCSKGQKPVQYNEFSNIRTYKICQTKVSFLGQASPLNVKIYEIKYHKFELE